MKTRTIILVSLFILALLSACQKDELSQPTDPPPTAKTQTTPTDPPPTVVAPIVSPTASDSEKQ
jgi:hypothetical protein